MNRLLFHHACVMLNCALYLLDIYLSIYLKKEREREIVCKKMVSKALMLIETKNGKIATDK